ncbi:CHAP domain-containing protein [Amycolatopsis sp. NPDC059657]|uniref:CHAP domain-containing protein n=1 Tax=Amycolatopsis sp. NPDC059657 TaxID=3346899 RepID=UPI00366ED437
MNGTSRRLARIGLAVAGALTMIAGSLTVAALPAQAATGADIANVARAQLGKGCGGNPWPCHSGEWCADFAGWVWRQAGVDANGITAAAASFVSYGRARGTITNQPHVGDAIVYQYDGAGWAAHVNIVTGVRGDGYVQTVGGNEGGGAGSVRFVDWHAPGNWNGPIIIVRPFGVVGGGPPPVRVHIEEFTGDWDGNGTTTVGIHRGNTFYLRNSNSGGVADVTFGYGDHGWIPIVGDWNGTGRTSVGVYNPATATFYLRSSTDPANATTTTFVYGDPGWIPITGDWTGTGRTSVGVYNPATSMFYERASTDPNSTVTVDVGFGDPSPSWVPVTGDWNGDGRTTVGLYNLGNANFYLRDSNTSGVADVTFGYGNPNEAVVPVSGHWNGRGPSTIGIYRPSNAYFYLRNSNSGGVADSAFGYGDPRTP